MIPMVEVFGWLWASGVLPLPASKPLWSAHASSDTMHCAVDASSDTMHGAVR